MKRKLSSTNSEPSSPSNNDVLGNVDEKVQPLSELELEQSAGSSNTGGFLLAPHLARSLGMQSGEMLFRSMFYGTSRASLISNLAVQLLNEQEELVRRELGEGTSSAIRLGDSGGALAFMASNEATIQALLDSIEAPQFAVVPAVIVEGVDTIGGKEPSEPKAVEVVDAMYWREPGSDLSESVSLEGVDSRYWQAPSASEQSTRDCNEGLMFAPDLSLEPGMYHDQVLCQNTSYGTPQSNIFLGMASQLPAVQEDLLCNQALERSVATQEVIRFGYEDTAALMAANEELMQAPMTSIGLPSFTAVSKVVVVDSEEVLADENSLEKLEEGRLIDLDNEEILRIARKEMVETERLRAESKAEKARARAERKIMMQEARAARSAMEGKVRAERGRKQEASTVKMLMEEKLKEERRAERERREVVIMQERAEKARFARLEAERRREEAKERGRRKEEMVLKVRLEKEREAMELKRAKEIWRVGREEREREAREAKARREKAVREATARRERVAQEVKAERTRLAMLKSECRREEEGERGKVREEKTILEVELGREKSDGAKEDVRGT